MNRDITSLEQTEFDLVVIGGGIFGICAAWDAVLRGLSVALIEKNDFCAAASANSFKMVHGGIRYIQHLDVIRVWSSCRERSAFLRIAPHLVQPLPILIPTYGHGKSGREFLSTGCFLYDALTIGRNRGIPDRSRHIPLTRPISRSDVLEEFPDIESNRLTGGVVFCDGQMYNPPRLAISVLRAAASKGVVAANYVEATGFRLSGQRVAGVTARDRVSGSDIEIRAKMVVNAAGPWAEGLLRSGVPIREDHRGVYSRDTCFIVRRKWNQRHALAVQGRTHDPDALLSRPARHLFMVPWRDYSLIGVWHVVKDVAPRAEVVSDEEIESYIDEINWACPWAQLSLEDVTAWNAGLVPFGDNDSDAVNLSYGKRSILIDHAKRDGIAGLVTLIGIRYTMARGDAAKAVDMAVAQSGRAALPRRRIAFASMAVISSCSKIWSRRSIGAIPVSARTWRAPWRTITVPSTAAF